MVATINALNVDDVHRITSGQVIIDLTTAIKELVDNSIDAEASNIEITFKNYGIDSIECSDDGIGISPENYESLALKSFTSKISSFDDIQSITTMGFRGEALSSLCAISDLEVTTTVNPPRADKLNYDFHGKLVSKVTATRNKGTSILVTKLFHSLPVRQKEFKRTAKKQFTDCIGLLQSYAVIQEGIRFLVNNISPNGRKQTLISTTKNSSLDRRIKSIFGSNSMRGLDTVDLMLDLNPYKTKMIRKYQEDPISFEKLDYKIHVTGYISKNSFGCGRNSKDRQFLFVNDRPILYPSIAKCCNEIYRTFNTVQYPSFFLNIQVSPELLDINVTPDKRTVILHYEQIVIDILKEELSKYFDGQDLVLPRTSRLELDAPPLKKIKIEATSRTSDRSHNDFVKEIYLEEEKYFPPDSSDTPDNVTFEDNIREEPDTSSRTKESCDTQSTPNFKLSQEVNSVWQSQDNKTKQLKFSEQENEEEDIGKEKEDNMDRDVSDESDLVDDAESESELPSFVNNEIAKDTHSTDNLESYKHSEGLHHISLRKVNEISPLQSQTLTIEIDGHKDEQEVQVFDDGLVFLNDNDSHNTENDKEDTVSKATPELNDSEDLGVEDTTILSSDNSDDLSRDYYRSENFVRDQTKNISIHRTLDDALVTKEIDEFYTYIWSIAKRQQQFQNGLKARNFESKFNEVMNGNIKNKILRSKDNPTDEALSEEYMTLTVKKEDFKKMKVVGQFNLGFIIVTRKIKDKYDLFIVDQHASDEKFNFETLQKTTVFKSQKLIVPQKVDLNVIDELVVLDNLDIFTKNGFKIKVTEDAEADEKIQLISLPVSKRTNFDINDFHELIHLIKESGGLSKNSIRCSKIRSMFAMRACRSSVMIGKPLNKKTMSKIVEHLSELHKPWNCPHGRPTMRHLIELENRKTFVKDYML